jgi:hypothetical protein
MKIYLLLLSFPFFISSCELKESVKYIEKTNTQANSIDSINATSIKNPYDSLGSIISAISFKTIGSKVDKEIFEDGIIPWVNIDSPDNKINALIDVDKIVLPYSNVKLIIDYPLNKPATFLLSTNKNGFTNREIIHLISQKYHQIYTEEESTSTIKTLPLNERKGLINRNETEGKYGICCHDISDLDLSLIEIRQNSKGEIYLTLGIES